MTLNPKHITIIGLGYVGLPLAVEFGKHRTVVGFDTNPKRIHELQAGKDHTLECSTEQLKAAMHLSYTHSLDGIRACQAFIVNVPTTVDTANRPDMSSLIKASQTGGQVLKKGDILIYESTVYPGATEEVCVSVLEQTSGVKLRYENWQGIWENANEHSQIPS